MTAAVPSGAATHARWPAPLHHARHRPTMPRPARASGCRAAGTRSPHRDDLANFNGAELRARAAGSNRHPRLDIRRLDDEIPGDDLLRLGERPIQDPPHPVAAADPLRLNDRAQRRASLQRAVTYQVHRVLTPTL